MVQNTTTSSFKNGPKITEKKGEIREKMKIRERKWGFRERKGL